MLNFHLETVIPKNKQSLRLNLKGNPFTKSLKAMIHTTSCWNLLVY